FPAHSCSSYKPFRRKRLMSDLLKQVAGAADTDEARQAAIYMHIIESLSADLRDTAVTLAVPHWFDQSIARQLREPRAPVELDQIEALVTAGLLTIQPGATYSFPDRVRELLLRRLIEQDLDRFRRISAIYADIFMQTKAETAAAALEGIYNALGADPKSGGRLMLERGLLLKSEPFFQWDALDRL